VLYFSLVITGLLQHWLKSFPKLIDHKRKKKLITLLESKLIILIWYYYSADQLFIYLCWKMSLAARHSHESERKDNDLHIKYLNIRVSLLDLFIFF
jgi:hypothetical protein